MAISPEYRDYVLDLLAGIGGVRAKSMFGGAGLYLDGTMFALIAGDVLYFRADDVNRPRFEEAGTGPFKPFADRPQVMPYWEVPAEVMDDGETLCDWARGAWEAARRNAKRKGK